MTNTIKECWECDWYDYCPSKNEYKPNECNWVKKKVHFIGTPWLSED